MLQKTKGIVINYIKFKESSIIVKIYTESLGLQSYIINGIRSAKGKSKIALYQPLTLLELVVYHQKHKNRIFRISEARCSHPFQSIPYQQVKSGMALFITEILAKIIREEEENAELFNFLYHFIQYLDEKPDSFEHLHLYFLLKLPRFLGFQPGSATEIFDQIEEYKKLLLPADMKQEITNCIQLLLKGELENFTPISSKIRSEIINYLLDFYRLHLEGFGHINSLEVLRELNR